MALLDPDAESIDKVARSIWLDMRCLMGDYDEVPFEHLLFRPRYQGIRRMLRRAAVNAIAATD